MKDPLINDTKATVEELFQTLLPALRSGSPFIFLGFAFGAIIAFEVACRMQAECHEDGPVAVFVVSAEAPPWPHRAREQHTRMSNEQFEKMLHDKGGTDFILQDEGMKKMFVPVIRADCILEESYIYEPAHLHCPIFAYFGRKVGRDKMKSLIEESSMNPWLEATTCKQVSKVEGLDMCDWYILQEIAGVEILVKAISNFMIGKGLCQ